MAQRRARSHRKRVLSYDEGYRRFFALLAQLLGLRPRLPRGLVGGQGGGRRA